VFFHLAPAEGSSATLPNGDGLEQRVQDMLDRFGDVRLKVLSGSAPVSLTTTCLPVAPRFTVAAVFVLISVAVRCRDVSLSIQCIYHPYCLFMQIKAWAQRLDRMKHELESYEDCQYASVTSADTLYGSEVVHNVLRAARHGAEDAEGEDTEGGDSGAERPPQLVFNPYDSRGTAEHGEFSDSL
jgi:hypothetical protein